jgi:hypothetical protein
MIGGLLFAISAAYLLWGILGDSLRGVNNLSPTDLKRITGNVLFACSIMKTSGIVLAIAIGVRFYAEEITGYALLIAGGLIYWGVPYLAGISIHDATNSALRLPVFIADTFMQVGMISMVMCPPLILLDMWRRITNVRSAPLREGTKSPELEEPTGTNSIFSFYCWQSPYCRAHLRRYCKAFKQHSACWRTKSGCFCDEDMILRTLQGNSATASVIAANKPSFSKKREYTSTQKRERCRQCFLYADHQNKKYRLMSPLVFPIAVFIVWTYHVPAKEYLGKFIEALAVGVGNMSFIPETQNVANQWASTPAASDSVEWIFLSCLGLIMATYMLRGLEYLIFELQI